MNDRVLIFFAFAAEPPNKSKSKGDDLFTDILWSDPRDMAGINAPPTFTHHNNHTRHWSYVTAHSLIICTHHSSYAHTHIHSSLRTPLIICTHRTIANRHGICLFTWANHAHAFKHIHTRAGLFTYTHAPTHVIHFMTKRTHSRIISTLNEIK